MGKKLTKKQNNKVTAKALECAAKQVAAQGTQELEKGSYPYDISVQISGELDVKEGNPGGVKTTSVNDSDSDLLAAMHATDPAFATSVSAAMEWLKSADKEKLKEHKAGAKAAILKIANRRKRVTERTSSPSAGAASSKPRVKLDGSVDTRKVEVKVSTP